MSTLASASRLLLAITLLTSTLFAATPSSGTITAPADDSLGVKQTFDFYGGPMAISTGFTNISLPACLQAVAPPGACDVFTLNVNLPANFYDTRASLLTAVLTWSPTAAGEDPSLNDVDIYIVDAANNIVGSSADTNAAPAGGTGLAREVAVSPNLTTGTYRVIIINSLSPFPIPRYDVNMKWELVQKPAPPPTGFNPFEVHTPPVVNGTRLGTGAAEPSIGFTQRGNVMYQAGLQTLRVTFDDSTKPARSSWTNVGAAITSRTSLDPILYTDPKTGRTFVSQLYAACSLMAFTDDDGATWFQNPIGCGIAAAVDHQTVGGGPFAPGKQANDPLFNYQHSAVYCAQAIASAQCSISTNGGITFEPAKAMYTLLDCGGLHGHVRTAPDGTLYVPNSDCQGGQGMAVSTDNGDNWVIRTVPGSTTGVSDPWIDVASDGTVYFGYVDGDGHAKVALSSDRGLNWTTPADLSTTHGLQNAVWAMPVVGDPDRAAVAFLGTQAPGDLQAATFPGNWYLYVAFTYDKGQTWTTYNATPNDPVQRGCIWLGGGSNPCRNLLDFNGITLDDKGRVLVGFADGCIDDPQDPADRCVSNPPGTAAAAGKKELAAIARQSGGIGLYAAYDGQVFTDVPGTPVLSGLAGNMVNHLTWTTPASNGSAITGYKIFRGTASGGETLYTQVGAVNAYDDTAVVNGATYYYRVAAVNGIGTGSTSNEIALTPAFKAAPSAPQRLKAVGKHDGVMLTWSAPSSSGTAPVTAYRIYRGTSSGAKLMVAEVTDGTTRYNDVLSATGQAFYYQVAAVNAVGESPKSNEASATPR